MMEDLLLLNKTASLNELHVNTIPEQNTCDRTTDNPILEALIAEGGEDFFNYLNWLGLSGEPDLLILSSKHHYYYDHNDLRGVRILINLKKLNYIKHLDSFLHVVFRMLPPQAKFIGCFTGCQSTEAKGFPFYQTSNILTRLINFLDSRIDRRLQKDGVSKILERHGFKVLDMTAINGDVYFSTQSSKI
jgi:hypothetical protein